MRETFSEWECTPGNAPGLIESMDAAGFAASVPAQGEEANKTCDSYWAEP